MKQYYVTELDNPLVRYHVSRLRDASTPPYLFRRHTRALSTMLSVHASEMLHTRIVPVQTPLEQTDGFELSERVGLIPILRAGLGMVDPILEIIPQAEVWHLGFYRDETTHEPVEYYQKLNAKKPVDVAFVLDPMLATGGSANAAIQAVKDWGAEHVVMLCLLAAPEGIHHVHQAHPDTPIFTTCIDRKLNDQAYILPGLGDAGDRIFNTL